MQVSVEVTQGLERRMTVGVPKERIEEEIQNRLKSMSRTVRLDGFRPGKIPLRVMQQKFGSKVRQEVIKEVVESTFIEAASQQNLQPAGYPQVEVINGKDKTDEDLAYTAAFEIYPEIKNIQLEGISIEKMTAEIVDSNVDNLINTLRKQRQTWQEVERPSQEGDQVVVEYTARVEEQETEETNATPVRERVILGSKLSLPGFEEGLIGKQKEEKVELDLQFPEDYRRRDRAGKKVHISAAVQHVYEPVIPELDTEFVKAMGVPNGEVEVFREEVRKNMQRELNKTIKTRLKTQTLDALLAANEVEVPKILVEYEAERLMKETEAELEAQGMKGKIHLPPQTFNERAQKRVKLGLLITTLGHLNHIQAPADKVRQHVEELAATYENPQSVVRWFFQDKKRVAEAEAAVLEDEVVEWILQRVQVIEKKASFDELMKKIQQQATE